jgi:hypothetical protein
MEAEMSESISLTTREGTPYPVRIDAIRMIWEWYQGKREMGATLSVNGAEIKVAQTRVKILELIEIAKQDQECSSPVGDVSESGHDLVPVDLSDAVQPSFSFEE